MSKVRIYELAKSLNIESKELMAILDDMGVEYKSHASSLDEETAETVKQLVQEDSPTKPQTSEKPRSKKTKTKAAKTEAKSETKDIPLRAPVVSVMGHVDHGKTSLLDYIRKAKVASGEAGGITQHIGAYQTNTSHGKITFIDTPGHEAFTSIRQRGANATDIAIIVVAADDSIMPQTREAIAHAKAANIPIIVAINKIDLPQANPDKVKQDLMQVELVPEDFGGETIVVPISAQTGKGIDELLEMLSLVAEMEDLRADPDKAAKAIIVESVRDKQAGILVTAIIQEGTIKVGDYIVSGESWAKIRALISPDGKRIKEAGPSYPVQIMGFSTQPSAGDIIEAVGNEKEAKLLCESRITAREEKAIEDKVQKTLTLEDLFGKKDTTTVNIILRADTQGSLEAIKGVLAKEAAAAKDVELNIMLAAVGAPSESDLLLAGTGDAQVLAFGVNPTGAVKKEAKRLGIPLKSYKIIYKLIEDVQRLIRGQSEPEYEEKVIGHAEIRQVIKVPRTGNIAGSYITDGIIKRGAKARLMRKGKEVYKGSIAQLRRFKDDVRELGTGFECGINLDNYDAFREGDIIEAYELVEVPLA